MRDGLWVAVAAGTGIRANSVTTSQPQREDISDVLLQITRCERVPKSVQEPIGAELTVRTYCRAVMRTDRSSNRLCRLIRFGFH